MKLSAFSFIVTDDCNFNCSYCFQNKEPKYMAPSTIEKTVTFFYPYFQEKTDIVFFGGEPLLTFDSVKHAVSLLLEMNKDKKKTFVFSLSTNGSPVTREMLDYFNRHRFDLQLSFDALTQDTARRAGSLDVMRELIRRILTYPDIEFSTNSVAVPGTVSSFSESMRYLVDAGVKNIDYSLSHTTPWDPAALETLESEMERLTDFLLTYYREIGVIPVTGFRPPGDVQKKNFMCFGGKDRLAVSPDEDVWGCYAFHDYLKHKEESEDFLNYSFGKLDDFIQNHETRYPGVLENYSNLRQRRFFTDEQFCFLCEEKDNCSVCPVRPAYITGLIGRLPTWICDLNKIEKKAKMRFIKKINKAERL